MTRTITSLGVIHEAGTIDASAEILEAEDDAALTHPHAHTVTSNQYVIYSSTFQVPAFYFTMYDSRTYTSLDQRVKSNYE